MGERVHDAATSVADAAKDAASYVGKQAESASSAVASGLQSLSKSIRPASSSSHGMIDDASTAVANTLESTGRFLQDEGFKGIADDMTNLIRRNPLPALLIGVGFGFLLARATTFKD